MIFFREKYAHTLPLTCATENVREYYYMQHELKFNAQLEVSLFTTNTSTRVS